MDSTIERVINKVSDEYDLEPGLLSRIIELEESKAHLSRRHGLFDDLRDLTRKAAQRSLKQKGESPE